MKKTGSRRGPGFDPGLGFAVLDAPEESFALRGATVGAATDWVGRGPAPIGALQRGYPAAEHDPALTPAGESEYIPRRGSFSMPLRGLPRSTGGRIVLGAVAFAVVTLVVAAVVGTRYYLLHDERFVMAGSSDMQIMGDEHLSRPQVLGIFAADLQRNIFRVPLAERRADVERLPWVAHATVMRLLPNKIRVAITERTPVAFVRQGTQIGLVDAGGVLLDMPPEAAGDPHYSFPVLTGISPDLPLSTRAARMEVYRAFMKDLDSGGARLTDSLSEVDVSNPEDVKALVASGSSDIMVHFGDEAYLARYRAFEQHLPEWRQQYPRLASADMRYEGQIVLEMQGGGAPVTPGATAPANVIAAAGPEPPATPKQPSVTPVAASVTAPKAVPAKVRTAASTAVLPAAAKKPAAIPAARPAVKSAVVKHGGKSAANEKVFAALAAAQKARARTPGNAGVTP